MSHYEFAPVTEKYVHNGEGQMQIQKTQNVEHILEAAKGARELIGRNSGPANGRYLGTIPIVIAQHWAVECGAAVGTRPWAVYAKQKLKDPDFAGLRIHM